MRRNPIHYGAMSKYTKCFKAVEAVLCIQIDEVPNLKMFNDLFFQVQELEGAHESSFDPRKYSEILSEFKHLLSVGDYNRIIKEFDH